MDRVYCLGAAQVRKISHSLLATTRPGGQEERYGGNWSWWLVVVACLFRWQWLRRGALSGYRNQGTCSYIFSTPSVDWWSLREEGSNRWFATVR